MSRIAADVTSSSTGAGRPPRNAGLMCESPYLAEIRRPIRCATTCASSTSTPATSSRSTPRALELALSHTFAVPSIAQLLASTGEFTDRALKRYDDTDLLISTFAENGYDSAVGRAAIRRMNQIHGRFLKERSRSRRR
jgi:hypothetical protein